jgi:hypothetical protein
MPISTPRDRPPDNMAYGRGEDVAAALEDAGCLGADVAHGSEQFA